MWRKIECIKSPKFALSLTAGVVGFSALEGIAYADNQTFPVPPNSCISPAQVDPHTYIDPATDRYTSRLGYPQTVSALFTSGVVIEGTVPSGVEGVEATWTYPGASQEFMDDHASAMIRPDKAGRYVLKMTIGPEPVNFAIVDVAPQGSSACHEAPQATFTHKSTTDYFLTPATLPWTNISNGVVNEFAEVVGTL